MARGTPIRVVAIRPIVLPPVDSVATTHASLQRRLSDRHDQVLGIRSGPERPARRTLNEATGVVIPQGTLGTCYGATFDGKTLTLRVFWDTAAIFAKDLDTDAASYIATNWEEEFIRPDDVQVVWPPKAAPADAVEEGKGDA